MIQTSMEWQDANAMLIADSKSVAIELRQFTVPMGYTIEKIFEELNQQVLPSLSLQSQNALRALADRIEQQSKITTFAITRIESPHSDQESLSFDGRRLKILALAKKPGARLFTHSLHISYNSNVATKHLHYMTGIGWPKSDPRMFFVSTIPLEDESSAEEIAEKSQMRLSKEAPSELVKMPNGSIQMVDYPLQGEENLFYLINEPESAVYKEPGSGEDLFKIETMLLSEPNEELNE